MNQRECQLYSGIENDAPVERVVGAKSLKVNGGE
jgi:hypothetical protein